MHLESLELPSRSSVHIARKIWHCGMGSLGITLFLLSNIEPIWWGQVLVLVALMAFAVEWLRLNNRVLNKYFCRLASPFMRDTEVAGPTGFAFYALGVGLTLLLFEKDVALLACCYLVFADPAASLVGVKFGKTKILNGRSLEGTMTFFIVALMINLCFFNMSMFLDVKNFVVFSVITAISAALAEVICHGKYLDDNLIVPVVAGALITFSRIIF